MKSILILILYCLLALPAFAEQTESDDYTQDNADSGDKTLVDLRHSCRNRWTLVNNTGEAVSVNVSEYAGEDGSDTLMNAYDVDIKAGGKLVIEVGAETDTVMVMRGYEAQDIERARDCNNQRAVDVAPVVASAETSETLNTVEVYMTASGELGEPVLAYIVGGRIELDADHYADGEYAVFSDGQYVGRVIFQDYAGVFIAE